MSIRKSLLFPLIFLITFSLIYIIILNFSGGINTSVTGNSFLTVIFSFFLIFITTFLIFLYQKNIDKSIINEKIIRDQYRTIAQQIPTIAIQGFKADGTITFWNRAAEVLYGFSDEQSQGAKIQDLILQTEAEKEKFISLLRDIITTHKAPDPEEWEIHTSKGFAKTVYSYMFPFPYGGADSEILCFDIDITRLKETEKELIESAKNYIALFENSLDGIYQTTLNGKFVTANDSLAQMLGYSDKEELLKIDIPSELYFSPHDRETTLNIEGKTSVTYKVKKRDGQEMWVEETTRKFLNKKSEVIFEGIVRDVTSRKKSEIEKEKLYQEVELQKTIFEYTVLFAPYGMLIVDAWTGEVFLYNLANSKIFGINNDSVYKRYNLWEDPNLSEDKISLFHHLRDTGEVIYLPEYTWDPANYTDDPEILKYITKSAIIKTVAFPILDLTGKVTHFVIIKEDVTNQRNLEAQIRQAVKMESIGNLAGGIAHDFNNLLTGIIGNTSLVLSKLEEKSNLKNYLFNIEKASKRAADLTKQLLSFSRKTKINLKPINLNNCVDEILFILKRTVDPIIVLDRKIESTIWPINADSGQIIQVLMNLCINARDAIQKDIEKNDKRKYKISIETENVNITKEYCDSHFEGIPGDFVCLKISDNGCGIPKDALDKIFEPFFTTKSVGEGTGLGLAIVYGIIKQHNGWINVYSEPDLGTTFKIYIPRIIDSVENEDFSITPIIRRGKETLLFVDDDDIIRDLGLHTLEDYGYKVMLAKDGAECIEIFNKHGKDISLVLLDYAMPVKNGAEVIKEIKSINPYQKIILLSGYISDSQVISEVINQINCFIQKPFDSNYLATKVREILDER